MLDRARQRRAALEARLSNSDLSAGHKTPADANHGLGLSSVCNDYKCIFSVNKYECSMIRYRSTYGEPMTLHTVGCRLCVK